MLNKKTFLYTCGVVAAMTMTTQVRAAINCPELDGGKFKKVIDATYKKAENTNITSSTRFQFKYAGETWFITPDSLEKTSKYLQKSKVATVSIESVGSEELTGPNKLRCKYKITQSSTYIPDTTTYEFHITKLLK